VADPLNLDETVRLPAPTASPFSRYRLKAELGRGGMGVVWSADDTKLQREVALKFLPDAVVRDREAMADLAAETRRCLALTHPHIVRVYDLIEESGRAAISMELVDGPSLAVRKLREPDRCFTVATLQPWIAQLCSALDYAHTKARIVHRDLKPLNLLVNSEGDLKVVDFGISRSLRSGTGRLSLPHAASLSIGYAGPQQALGESASVSDDIYSLGATIYELLTGKPPFFEGDILAQLREIVPPTLAARRTALGVTPRDTIPPAWEKTVAACLAKRPADRPASAAEVAALLGLSPGRDTVTLTGPAPAAPRRSLVPLLSVTAVLAAAATYFLRPAPPAPASASAPVLAPAPAVPAGPEFVVRVSPPDVGARIWLAHEKNVAVPDSGELRLAAIPPGEHELTVQASGHRPARIRVSMTDAGGQAEVALVPVPAAVQIFGRPGTQVTALDARGRERPVGLIPATGPLSAPNLLTVGTYRFRLLHPDCLPAETAELTLVAARPTRVSPPQTARPGELRVFSAPDGADIAVAGIKVGTTPATIPLPSEKSHAVVVTLRGHRPAQINVTLKPGETQTFDVGTLVAAAGTIELRHAGKPLALRGIAVRVDGTVTAARNGKIDNVDVGLRQLEITHADYETWKGEVTLADRATKAVDVALVPKPAQLTLSVSGPAQFTTTVNGKPATLRNHVVSLPAGEKLVVEIGARGYKSARHEFTLAPRAREKLEVTLEKIPVPEPGQPWQIPDLGLVLLPVAAGKFTMGSRIGDTEERPTVDVTLTKPFWLGRTEVTQAEWRALMPSNPSRFKGDTLPVESVSWTEAVEFCRLLTERERKAERLPAGYSYALPTEAQWEFACRAGDTADLAHEIARQAWHSRNSGDATHPVASLPANAWGLHDMLGNVWEWCSDRYQASLPKTSVTDPKGPPNGENRVRRGGSYVIPPDIMRYARRGLAAPEYKTHNLGFRVALVPGP
jgi:formylglycine-generating enzyme required for sulfatase activity